MRYQEIINETEVDPAESINPELQKLIDVAENNGQRIAASRTLRYQLFVPRLPEGTKRPRRIRESIKPNAELWTSTAIRRGPNSYTSAWAEWCYNNMPQWLSKTGRLYRVNNGARVLNLGSDDAARKVAALFGRQYTGGRYEILGNYPWAELGKYFDAVRYPARLSNSWRSRQSNTLMSLWDVESTAWYNTQHLTLIREVNIDVRGW